MSVPIVPIIQGVGAVTTLAGSMQAAKAQRQQGTYQAMSSHMSAERAAEEGVDVMFQAYHEAEMKRLEAQEIREQAEEQAELIRSAARKFRASQTAVAAHSGVMVHEGSAQMMLDETSMLAERDAIVAIMQGNDGALIREYEADNLLQTGSNAFRSSFYEGVNSRLNAHMYQEAGKTQANATLLSGVAGAAKMGASAYQSYEAAKLGTG